MNGLGAFDIAAVAVILILMLYGMLEGFVRLALGFIGLALGWYLAMRYCELVALRLGATPADAAKPPGGMRLIAFTLIFVGVVIVCGLLAWMITKALGAVKLRWIDRLIGGGAGLLAAIVLICAATVPLAALLPEDGGRLMRNSRLAPYAVAGGEYLETLAPASMKERFSKIAKSVLSK
jgi:membrane protein required for colicin V production